MNNAALEKKFTDKEFLKTNDFAGGVGKVVALVRDNKMPMLVGLILVVLAGLSVPAISWYRAGQVKAFGEEFYQAKKGLKKEEAYRQLIAKNPQLSASQLVRLELVDTLVGHDDIDAALKVINEGIIAQKPDIFNTLLVVRGAGLLKAQNKFDEAANFAKAHQVDVLKTFINHLKFLQADLMVSAGKQAEAKVIYQELTSPTGVGVDASGSLSDFDPQIAAMAKEKVLLIDMGLL